MMRDRSVQHDTIVLDRTFDASVTRVFAAWSDPEAKARWDVPEEDWEIIDFTSDFRVGGREVSRFGPPGGPVYTSDGRYEDIVPNARIVMAGTMSSEQQRVSTSVMTVEFLEAGTRTRLILTEQAAFLDGADTPASRRSGWSGILDKLVVELQRSPIDPPA
jgi:uncharacterized protein YndB with AHSA1/START domain